MIRLSHLTKKYGAFTAVDDLCVDVREGEVPGFRDAALPEPRLIVTGDSDFLANGLITCTANRDHAVRMMAWLTGVEEARVVAAAPPACGVAGFPRPVQ